MPSGSSPYSHRLRRAAGARIRRDSLTSSPAGIRAERRFRRWRRRLRGLRASVSVSAGASVRGARPGLGACRVSVAWPACACVRVCVCLRASVCAQTPPPPPPRRRASASAGPAAREGAGAQRASGPAAGRLSVRPGPPRRPAPSAGLSAARPRPPPLPAGSFHGHTRTHRHTAAGRGPRPAPTPQLQRPGRRRRPRGPRSPRPLAPGLAPAPIPAHPRGLRVPPTPSRAHSTAGGKLAAGRAARGAQRPPAHAGGRPRPPTSPPRVDPSSPPSSRRRPALRRGQAEKCGCCVPILSASQLRLGGEERLAQGHKASLTAETVLNSRSTLVRGPLAAAHYPSPTLDPQTYFLGPSPSLAKAHIPAPPARG